MNKWIIIYISPGFLKKIVVLQAIIPLLIAGWLVWKVLSIERSGLGLPSMNGLLLLLYFFLQVLVSLIKSSSVRCMCNVPSV